jgi:AcrR family transcriptional regulator
MGVVSDMTDADGLERHRRGRPQVRPDEKTRKLIFGAARYEFESSGYAATSMEDVARRAGISTKTLYRIVPHKAALLRDLVFDRFDQFAIEYFELHVRDHVEIEGGLNEALTFCANFALHPEIVGLQRVILQEIFRFPELAASFYATGITRIAAELSKWLRDQVTNDFIAIDDCDEVAGVLIGMVVSAPQRANLYAGMPLPSRRQIERRVQSCVTLFLNGCRVRQPANESVRTPKRD